MIFFQIVDRPMIVFVILVVVPELRLHDTEVVGNGFSVVRIIMIMRVMVIRVSSPNKNGFKCRFLSLVRNLVPR